MLKLKGLATGIGSLPYKDVETALDLVFKSCPQIPFWPQLPKRDMREGMVAQFSEGLPCLETTDKGIFFNPKNKENKLEEFYQKIIATKENTNGNIDYFAISREFAAGLYGFFERLRNTDLSRVKYLKCQITGPFTFAASIKDEKGVALLHDPIFMQAITEGLKMKVLWQIRFFWGFGKKIIVFIDEPYLGCFGSAYTPINRGDVVSVLRYLANKITDEGAVVGLHCCGNTDWSIFVDANIDIINFDAFSFLDKLVLYADDLKRFQGDLCWGIVPTQEFSGKETAELLVEKIENGIKILRNKGLDADSLWENLFISPACGLGALDETKAEKIFALLRSTSQKILTKINHLTD